MFQKKLIASAIVGASVFVAQQATAEIEEVIVTATKQQASTQDIPVAVSAVTEDSLEQLGITNFEDYLVQLPGVTAGGNGPGQNTIYIRGVASTTPNLTTSGVAGLAPNVALYLDEQPLSQPGRNLDVYAADLARVEVLKGPQGTLFGASSQAGTVRLITNKPDLSEQSGKLKLGMAFTKSGDPSHSVEGVVNLPITDSFAVRAVAYADRKGGYIDNVQGSVTARESAGFQADDDLSGVTFVPTDNGSRTEKNFNDSTYAGGRVSALWLLNDDWSLNVGAAQQTLETEGVFFQDPELDDLEIQRYEEDQMEDSFTNVNWTLDGRIGALDVLYTGAFTEREAQSTVDYTDYLFVGQYIPYYICDASVSDPGDGVAPSGTCQAPNLFVKSSVETEVQTHELRFSTDQSSPLRVTAGAFYSDLDLRELNSFTYPGSELAVAFNGEVGFGPNYAAGQRPGVDEPTSSAADSNAYPEGVIWRNDVLRTDTNYGVFGELTADLGDQFSVTAGARYYDVEVDLKGSAAGSYGNLGATEDNNAGNNLDTLFSGDNDVAATDGVIGKLSLSYTPTDNQLYYLTWSEGYRPGLLNRPGGKVSKDGSGYTVPFSVDTDEVVNIEFGWKLDLLDNTLRLNGDIFHVEITDMQIGIFDASITNLFFSDNAANAEVTGAEAEFMWSPNSISGLLVSGAFSVLDTEITDSFVTNFVQEGDHLAFAPEYQGNLQARYEWSVSGGKTAHVMPHASFSDGSYTDIVVPNRSELDGWTMLGMTAGVSSDEWTAELYVDNLTDERAEISGNATFNRERVVIARPRTLGMRLSYNF